MGKYELTIVLDGKVTSAKKKTTLDKITKLVETYSGKVVKTEEWGVRDLAFKIGKSETGFFVHLQLELETKGAKLLADKIRLEEDLIRYLLIRA